jgi:hypothetical protein
MSCFRRAQSGGVLKSLLFDETSRALAVSQSRRESFKLVVRMLGATLLTRQTLLLADEDCGSDKGKCSNKTDHCCKIGASGWCCPKDKRCGDVGQCK